MSTKIICLICVSIVCSQFANASRKLISVPIGLSSIAGDLVCSNPVGEGDPMKCLQTTPCVSADVKGIEILGQGVKVVAHFYQLQLLNISNIEQNVTVDFENILLGYSFSSPPLISGINNGNGGPTKLAKQQKIVKIPPNSNVGIYYGIKCHSGTACISEVGAASPVDIGIGKPGYTCQALNSEIRVTITVKEDRGAIQAVLINGGHRSHGIADHFYSSPATIQINGGRPF